ncbi:MAG TPA: hypothetical protein VD995_20480 [Azospirillum sp.]|nr:hypothetical protein [Azospirillum sp.]
MRIRLFVGATLLAVAALTAGPAFALDLPSGQKKGLTWGTICVENAGAFVIETSFNITNSEANWANRFVETGAYPILQTKCVDFLSNDAYAEIKVHVVAGIDKTCNINLSGRAGQNIKARIHGTTLINQLDCPR